MSTGVCSWCFNSKKGDLFFKTKEKYIFKCYHHNENRDNINYLKINTKEIQNLKKEYIEYCRIINFQEGIKILNNH